MKINAVRTLLTLLVLAGVPSWAGEITLLPDLSANAGIAATRDTAPPLASQSRVFRDFSDRLQAAVVSGDLGAIRALYRTNGVAAEDIGAELASWQQLLRESDHPRVRLYFKELGTLPAQAREYWTNIAEHLTKREVTHLVGVTVTSGIVERQLPLVIVDDRLWIVPSDASSIKRGIGPRGAANGSQPIRSETNSTSSAAGSRR